MQENIAHPKEISALAESLRGLPGVGRRTAERIALAMARWPRQRLDALAAAVAAVRDGLGECPRCGNLSSAAALCPICADPGRDAATVCVVEESDQIPAIEASGLFRGVYHVLGGKLSPIEGRGPDDIRLAPLLARTREGHVAEVLLALSADIEGQATAHYIADMLRGAEVKVTMLARGLPAGAEIAYANAATMAAALLGRTPVPR